MSAVVIEASTGLLKEESRLRHKMSDLNLDMWIPLFFLAALAFACFIWPLVYPLPAPVGADVTLANKPPLSPGHILGTDYLGNDVMSRILYGGRVSLEVGIASNLIGCAIGGGIGAFAGYRRGSFDGVVMRVLDVLLAFPPLVLLLVVAEYLGPSEFHVIWAISFFTVPSFARLARSYTLRLREETFITAAKVAAVGPARMLRTHVLPNIGPQMLTLAVLGIGGAIAFEAALSFLGLGIRPPAPTWGNMINAGETFIQSNPIQVVIPVTFLVATILSFNLLGDALRSRWNVGA